MIADLLRYLEHPAYIRVNGRPLLRDLPDGALSRYPANRGDLAQRVPRHGLGEIYLAAVESFELSRQGERGA